MKKFLLLTAMAVVLGAVLKAQETPINVKPNSRAGGTIGLSLPENELNMGMCVGIFFHQTISRSWFFSIDAGYQRNTLLYTDQGVKSCTSHLISYIFFIFNELFWG